MLAVETATLVSLWSLRRIPSTSPFKFCMLIYSHLTTHILSESIFIIFQKSSFRTSSVFLIPSCRSAMIRQASRSFHRWHSSGLRPHHWEYG